MSNEIQSVGPPLPRASVVEPQRPAPAAESVPAKQPTADTAPPADTVARSSATVSPNNDLRFRVDDVLDRLVVSVVDRRTGETLRQLPPEEMLRLARYLAEDAKRLMDVTV